MRMETYMLISDTKHERNYLMEKAYPKLKSFCKQLGYEFQVGVIFRFWVYSK